MGQPVCPYKRKVIFTMKLTIHSGEISLIPGCLAEWALAISNTKLTDSILSIYFGHGNLNPRLT